MNSTRLFLLGAGLLFLAVGVGNLMDPLAAMKPVELQFTAISSFNEMRANYGGMHSFLGLFFIYSSFTQRLQPPALMMITIFSSGLVLGRVTSLVLDGTPNAAIFIFLAIEIFGAFASFVLLRRSSQHFL